MLLFVMGLLSGGLIVFVFMDEMKDRSKTSALPYTYVCYRPGCGFLTNSADLTALKHIADMHSLQHEG